MEIIHDKETDKVTVTFDSPKEAYDAFEPVDYDVPGPGVDEIQREMQGILLQKEKELLKEQFGAFLNVKSYGLEIDDELTSITVRYGTDCKLKVYRNKQIPPQNYTSIELKVTDIMTTDQVCKAVKIMETYINRY